MSVTEDARTFGTLPTIDGHDVIELDSGRPVAHRDSLRSANGVAYNLNRFVLTGDRKGLVKVLSRLR